MVDPGLITGGGGPRALSDSARGGSETSWKRKKSKELVSLCSHAILCLWVFIFLKYCILKVCLTCQWNKSSNVTETLLLQPPACQGKLISLLAAGSHSTLLTYTSWSGLQALNGSKVIPGAWRLPSDPRETTPPPQYKRLGGLRSTLLVFLQIFSSFNKDTWNLKTVLLSNSKLHCLPFKEYYQIV